MVVVVVVVVLLFLGWGLFFFFFFFLGGGGGVTPLSCFDTSCDSYAYIPPVEWTKSLTPTTAFALQMKSQIQRMTLKLHIFPLGHSFQAIGL